MTSNGSGVTDLGALVPSVVEAETQLAAIELDYTPLVTKAAGLMVASEEENAVANEIMASIVQVERRLEERRTFFTVPLNKILDGINKSARMKAAALIEAKRSLNVKMSNWLTKKEEERKKEVAKQQAKIEKAIENDRPIPVLKPVEVVAKSQATASGSTVTMISRWKAEVVNEAEIPREYLMVDTTKLNAYARAMKTGAKVKGVRFFEEKTAAVR